MTSWSDVAGKGLDFIQKPTGLGVVVVLAILIFLMYTLPLGVVTWTAWQNTERLERAILKQGEACSRSIVSRSLSK